MRTIIATLIMALGMLYTGQAQDRNEHYGDWNVGVNDQGVIYFYTTVGKQLKGGDNDVDLTFLIDNNETGTIYIQIDKTSVYNYSEDNKNYLETYIIVDNGEKEQYYGKIDPDGYIQIAGYKAAGTTQGGLMDKLKKGNTIYIQTIGAGQPKVFKFSLKGFNEAHNRVSQLFLSRPKNGSNNNDDPFKG